MNPDVRSQLREALERHQAGDVHAALAGYQQVLEVQPDNPDALNLCGVAHASLGDAAAAVAALERCVAVAPDFVDAHGNLALAYRGAGRHEDALAVQRRVLEMMPGHPHALNEMAITLRRLGRYAAALAALDEALAAEPGLATAHVNRGNVLQDLDRMEEAASSYREAAQRGAGAAAWRGVGNALQRLHRVDEAIEAYREALRVEPEHLASMTDLGGALVEAGRAEEGVPLVSRAAALAPEDVMLQSNLGIALHEAGDPLAARDAFERALALDPGNTHALAFFSITLHELGETQRWHEVNRLDEFVREIEPPLPPGYDSHAALNDDLAGFATSHPSVWSGRRRGISSELLLDAQGPPAALGQSIRAAVEAYIESLATARDHPFVARRPSRFLLSGWCNVLDEGAASHIHPNAWLSGVYYVRTAGVVDDGEDGRDGCLQVGPPDLSHYSVAGYPERVFHPREGRMVVFPSYVWHRILPFSGRGQRISYAFDVVPLG